MTAAMTNLVMGFCDGQEFRGASDTVPSGVVPSGTVLSDAVPSPSGVGVA